MENTSVTMQCAWKDEIDRMPTVEGQRWIPVNKELPVGGLMVEEVTKIYGGSCSFTVMALGINKAFFANDE